MNAGRTIGLFIVLISFGMSAVEAREGVGTAKARGDYRSYSQVQQSESYTQPVYRYSAPTVRSAAPTVAQAPSEARRYSVAPSTDGEIDASTDAAPCPSASSAPDSGRRYSYAPSPVAANNAMRSYSGNAGHSSQPTWSLPKTDARKFDSH